MNRTAPTASSSPAARRARAHQFAATAAPRQAFVDGKALPGEPGWGIPADYAKSKELLKEVGAGEAWPTFDTRHFRQSTGRQGFGRKLPARPASAALVSRDGHTTSHTAAEARPASVAVERAVPATGILDFNTGGLDQLVGNRKVSDTSPAFWRNAGRSLHMQTLDAGLGKGELGVQDKLAKDAPTLSGLRAARRSAMERKSYESARFYETVSDSVRHSRFHEAVRCQPLVRLHEAVRRVARLSDASE